MSLGTRDDSRIAACTYQLDKVRGDLMLRLREHVDQWADLYRRAYDNYLCMAQAFERERRFPHDLFDYWATTDGFRHGSVVSGGGTIWEARGASA